MRRRSALALVLALAASAATAQAPDTRAIDREIERLRGQLVALGAAEQAGEGVAADQRARLNALNAQEAVLKTRIYANRGDLAKLLAALETYQRRPPPPLLVNPRSAKDAVRAAILIRAVTPELRARGRDFAAQAEALAKVRRTAAAASEGLFQAESDIADRRAKIDRLTADKQALENRVYTDTGAPDAATRGLAARAGSVEAFVEGLTPPVTDAPPPASAPERMSPPVQGTLIRRFGDPQPGREPSQGWTWRTAPGAAVLSPAPGRVDYAGPLKGWGLVLILDIGGGRRLVLAGLDSASIGVGRSVAAGEPVGRLALAVRQGATAPELYLEVRDRTGAMNPGRWLQAQAAPTPNSTVRR